MPPSTACAQLFSCRRLVTRTFSRGTQRPLQLLHLRHRFRRTHVRPDASARFHRRIRAQLDLVFEAQITGFVWHVDALPTGIELPAVVGAADAFLLVASPEEMRVAVRAVSGGERNLAGGGAKRDQILAKHANGHGIRVWLGKLFGEEHGDPETAKHLAHRRARSDLAKEVSFGFAEHAYSLSSRARFH